jgi:hypothetical protein
MQFFRYTLTTLKTRALEPLQLAYKELSEPNT